VARRQRIDGSSRCAPYQKLSDTVGGVGSSGEGGEARVVSFRVVACRPKLLLHPPADHVAHEHDACSRYPGWSDARRPACMPSRTALPNKCVVHPRMSQRCLRPTARPRDPVIGERKTWPTGGYAPSGRTPPAPRNSQRRTPAPHHARGPWRHPAIRGRQEPPALAPLGRRRAPGVAGRIPGLWRDRLNRHRIGSSRSCIC
jgi:hypothetical protein